MPLLVLAAHCDDSALGAGQAMVAAPGSTAVTVFAGLPEGDLPLTGFDINSGFTSARDAMAARRAEDRRACAVLDATPIHLDHLDRQYSQPQDPTRIVSDLAEIINKHQDHVVLVPMGLVHPDHQLVSDSAKRACASLGREYLVYEELPARVLWPEEVRPDGMSQHGLPAGALTVKEAAIACYSSQEWCLDRHACLCPERFWKPADV